MAKTLKLLIWGILFLGGLELTARYVLFPQYVAMLPDMYERKPGIGHYNRPNMTVRRYNPMNYDVVNRTNSLGMRGLEKNMERELAGVWVIGSSNTFGGYVEDEEVYAHRLKQHGIWAANLASEGHTMQLQAAVARSIGARGYRPRAVVLSLTMYLAISDFSTQYGYLTGPLSEETTAVSVPTARENLASASRNLQNAIPTNFKAVRARLLRSSALYGWLKVGIMGIPSLRDWTLRNGLRADIDMVRNFDLNLLRPLERGNPAVKNIRSTADFVAAIGKMVRDTFGVPFGVVILPARNQLYPESFQRFAQHYSLQDQDLDPERSIRALEKALLDRGIDTLNTLPALRKSGHPALTFPDDGHLTAPAHGIVAAELAAWLKSKILPQKATGGGT